VTGLSYDDLVAVATVGVARRPELVTGLAGPAAAYAHVLSRADPAASVLDAAALLTVARRAGWPPVPGVRRPEPAAADAAPELSPRAARLLGQAREADAGLLADLLTAAAAAGYRAPAPLLPDLLDAATSDRALRPAVAGVLGQRGRWLAAHRADWQRVADGAAGPDPADGPELWQTGRRAERISYLAALRGRDPAAGRELLAAGWASETGDDRAALLPVLARELSPADEEFLEAALDDRKGAVRAAAVRLLARLPGSAWCRRATARATPLLQLAGRAPRRTLAARLPGGLDPAAARDGIGGPPPPGISVAAWQLTQVIAAVPLDQWAGRFRLTPAEIVTRPVAGDLARHVHAGWRLATVRQANPDWAAALLAADARHPQLVRASDRSPAAWPADGQLAAVLPPAAQAARVAALLSRTAITPEALAELRACPGPWPASLAEVVVSMLRTAVTGAPGPPGGPSGWPGSRWAGELAAAAARNLPATGGFDYAAALSRLAEASPCPPPWPVVLHRIAGTIALRRAFSEEIR
jgi:hypothetical protein